MALQTLIDTAFAEREQINFAAPPRELVDAVEQLGGAVREGAAGGFAAQLQGSFDLVAGHGRFAGDVAGAG